MYIENIKTYCKAMYNFTPKEYQAKFIKSCLDDHRVVAVWCRQSGKSESISKAALLLAESITKPILIFAPTDRQAGLLASKIMFSINQIPKECAFQCNRMTQREFYFSNGASIICETVGDKGESVRGYTAGAIILEEAGSIKDSIISSVILPMGSTTNAKIIKIGTPRGKNHFFESSRDPLYTVHLYNYEYPVSSGLISAEYIEEQRKVATDIVFRTEYCAEFIEDQDAFFSYELIESCKDGSLAWGEYVPEQGYTFYLGADIARLGQDSTALIVLKVKDRKATVVRIIEIKESTLDFVIERIIELHKFYKFKRVFIDETGLGAGVTDMLAKQFNMPKNQAGKGMIGFVKQTDYGDVIVGIKFTIQSKLDMFSNLKVIMQQDRLRYPAHVKLIAQLRDFRYELTENLNVKLHHSEGGHDDFVDALALACKEVNIKSVGYAL